ncbi:MAG: class I SAM-dependent methyltransferase [Candidatus Heimdallarchaeota archaeon]
MDILIRQFPVYRFLWFCEKSKLEKKVLDCGAGGILPPLTLFNQRGYETHGIDNSDNQVHKAMEFSNELGLDLNIIKGDMRKLPYENESFSFVYSFNTIFHLTKKDIKIALNEISRVLKQNGLIYINFLSTDDNLFGEGKEVGKGEYLQKEGSGEVVHTFFENDELNEYLGNFDILLLEKTKEKMPKRWGDYMASFFHCILQKK